MTKHKTLYGNPSGKSPSVVLTLKKIHEKE